MIEILGQLTDDVVSKGDVVENLYASYDNPARRGVFIRIKLKRSVTRYRKNGLVGTTEHFNNLVVLDTPCGIVRIHNDHSSKWLIERQH
jgi:hypothetical protein